MADKFVNCAQKIENLRKPIKAAPLNLPAPGIIRAAMADKLAVVVQLTKKPIETLVDVATLEKSAEIGAELCQEIIDEAE